MKKITLFLIIIFVCCSMSNLLADIVENSMWPANNVEVNSQNFVFSWQDDAGNTPKRIKAVISFESGEVVEAFLEKLNDEFSGESIVTSQIDAENLLAYPYEGPFLELLSEMAMSVVIRDIQWILVNYDDDSPIAGYNNASFKIATVPTTAGLTAELTNTDNSPLKPTLNFRWSGEKPNFHHYAIDVNGVVQSILSENDSAEITVASGHNNISIKTVSSAAYSPESSSELISSDQVIINYTPSVVVSSTVSVRSLDFGASVVTHNGTDLTVAQTIDYTNTGDTDLTVLDFGVNGADADRFVVTPDIILPYTIAQGTSLTLNVQMKTDIASVNNYQGNIVLSDNASRNSYSIALTGSVLGLPNGVTLSSPTNNSTGLENSFKLDWNKPNGGFTPAGYLVESSLNGDDWNFVVETSNTECNLTALNYNTEYQIKVRSYVVYDGTKYYTEDYTVWHFKTGKPIINSSVASIVFADKIQSTDSESHVITLTNSGIGSYTIDTITIVDNESHNIGDPHFELLLSRLPFTVTKTNSFSLTVKDLTNIAGTFSEKVHIHTTEGFTKEINLSSKIISFPQYLTNSQVMPNSGATEVDYASPTISWEINSNQFITGYILHIPSLNINEDMRLIGTKLLPLLDFNTEYSWYLIPYYSFNGINYYPGGVTTEPTSGYPVYTFTTGSAGELTGSGTSSDPYRIYNYQDWLTFSTNSVYWEAISTWTKKYISLESDIDLTASKYLNNGKGLCTVGNSTTPFKNKFAGNNHTLSNAYINRPTEDNIGLFGYTDGATIKGLKLSNCTFKGRNNVGSYVGKMKTGTYGFDSYADNDMIVEGYSQVGGIAGSIESSTTRKSRVSNVRFSGTVKCHDNGGGLFGKMKDIDFSKSYAKVTLNLSSSSMYESNIGGIVGTVETSTFNTVYSNGVLNGLLSKNVGGIAGKATTCTFSDSYSNAKIGGYSIKAGIVAESNYSNYNRCVTNYENLVCVNIGSGSVNNCYFLSGIDSNVNGTKLDLQDLSDQTKYIGWDFNSTWQMDGLNNNNIPWLRTFGTPDGYVAYPELPEGSTEEYIGEDFVLNFPSGTNQQVYLHDEKYSTEASNLYPIHPDEKIEKRYWLIHCNTRNPGDYNIEFDLSDMGFGPSDDVYMYKREDANSNWNALKGDWIYSTKKYIVNSLDCFSEFAVGSSRGGDSGGTPVTFASFNLVSLLSGNNRPYISVRWTTESENNLVGYNVFRSTTSDKSDSERINNMTIVAKNTSQTTHYKFKDADIEQGKLYYYWIETVEFSSQNKWEGPVSINSNTSGEGSLEIPRVTCLKNIYPNPFNPTTTVRYYVNEEQKVNINIYNLKGQLVNNLVDSTQNMGYHEVVWNGNDMNNNKCSSGTYFIKMKSNEHSKIMKAILIK